MTIEQEPFRKYNPGDKKEDTFTIRLNPGQRAILEECKGVMMQERDSTCFKQLALLGARKVLHDPETRFLIDVLFKNRTNNRISGVPRQEPEFPEM